jgi:hypothetical protein
MPQLSNRALGTLTLALVVACASNETAEPNAQSNAGTGSGGTSGTTGALGGGGNSAVGNSGSGGNGGTTLTGGTGGLGGTGGTPVGGFGGFAGNPVGGGGTGGGGTGGGGTGGGGNGGGGTGGGGTGGGGNGGGGTGGTAPVVVDPCVRTNWTPSASPTNVPGNAVDAGAGTRWTSAADQAGNEYFQIVFPSLATIDGITVSTTSADDFPAAYQVQFTMDGTTFSNPVDGDAGSLGGVGSANLVITLPDPTTVRGFRILQTGTSTYWWSIHNITVQGCLKYEAPDGGADGGDAG